MDTFWLLLAVTVALAALLAAQIALLVLDRRDRRSLYAKMLAIRVAVPACRVGSMSVPIADLEAVDFDAAQPLSSGTHDHVWGPNPFSSDSTSSSYRCQVPRCARVHTVHRGSR